MSLRARQNGGGKLRNGGGRGAGNGSPGGRGANGNSGASEPWNSGRKGSTVTLSNGNFTCSMADGNERDWAQTSDLKTTGKLYFEVLATTVNEASFLNVGVIDDTQGFENQDLIPGDQTRTSGGQWSLGGGAQLPASFTSGDVLGFAVDFSTRIITSYKNNVQQGLSAAWVVVSPGKRIGVILRQSSVANVLTIRTGADTQLYAPPSGYITWAAGN